MKAIRNFWESIILSVFKPVLPLPSGTFHYQTPSTAPQQYRLHLRVNPSGDGLLIVNASTVLHLNQTATEYAFHLVHQTPGPEAAKKVSQRYHVPYAQALDDSAKLNARIDTLIHEQDLDPVTFLDFDEQSPFSEDLAAPLRLDCALTYQYPAKETLGLTPTDRVKAELTTQEWKTVLEKAWQIGIPHVIFTGGEPTLRSDLLDLIKFAEELGMVSGLLTSGGNLSNPSALTQLLEVGLDHIMLLLDPTNDESWQMVQTLQVADVFLTVHLTIPPGNELQPELILKRLAEIGVTHLSISAMNSEFLPQLQACRQRAAELGMELIAELPVPYSQFHPVALELSESLDTSPGAGSKWLYLEPDGDVLPAQGNLTMMGNFLTDPWETIWDRRPKK
jgi:hypothetical protein